MIVSILLGIGGAAFLAASLAGAFNPDTPIALDLAYAFIGGANLCFSQL